MAFFKALYSPACAGDAGADQSVKVGTSRSERSAVKSLPRWLVAARCPL